jgi:hypothetical protein
MEAEQYTPDAEIWRDYDVIVDETPNLQAHPSMR